MICIPCGLFSAPVPQLSSSLESNSIVTDFTYLGGLFPSLGVLGNKADTSARPVHLVRAIGVVVGRGRAQGRYRRRQG